MSGCPSPPASARLQDSASFTPAFPPHFHFFSVARCPPCSTLSQCVLRTRPFVSYRDQTACILLYIIRFHPAFPASHSFAGPHIPTSQLQKSISFTSSPVYFGDSIAKSSKGRYTHFFSLSIGCRLPISSNNQPNNSILQTDNSRHGCLQLVR